MISKWTLGLIKLEVRLVNASIMVAVVFGNKESVSTMPGVKVE